MADNQAILEELRNRGMADKPEFAELEKRFGAQQPMLQQEQQQQKQGEQQQAQQQDE